MFVNDKDFRQHVADSFKVDVADLAAYWDRQCIQAHLSAYQDIRGALLTRGFAPAQIDAWDRGAEFEKDLGLFWACVRGVAAKSLDEITLNRLDRRAELLTVHVEVTGGNPQQPTGSPQRIVSGIIASFDSDGTIAKEWTKDTPL